MEIWYSGRDEMTVEIRSPNNGFAVSVKLGERAPIIINEQRVGTIYNRAREPNTLDNQVQIFLYREAPAGDWEVVIRAENVVDGRYHCWIEREPTRAKNNRAFTRKTPISVTPPVRFATDCERSRSPRTTNIQPKKKSLDSAAPVRPETGASNRIYAHPAFMF